MADHKMLFISYSTRDIAYVDKILNIIIGMGFSYWKAPEMIPAGSNYAREIPQAIQNCDVFLLLLSEASQKSIWVEKEVDSAINYHKHIVPVMLDDHPLNDMFKFYLNNVQLLIFRDELQTAEHFRNQLLLALENEKPAESAAKPSRYEKIRKDKYKKIDAFSVNQEPIECLHCGGAIQKVSSGVFVCKKCNRENYDFIQTVRNFLLDNGPHSAVAIEKKTGVPRKVVEQLLDSGLIEIASKEAFRLRCQSCGALIRSGTVCDGCRRLVPSSPKSLQGKFYTRGPK